MDANFGDVYIVITVSVPETEKYGISLTDSNYESSLTIQKIWSFTGATRIYVNSPTGSWTYSKSPSTQSNILGEDEYSGHAYSYGFLDIYVISQNSGAVSNRTATFTFYDSNGDKFGELTFMHMNNKWKPTPVKD